MEMDFSKDQVAAKKTILDWMSSSNRSLYLTMGGYAGTGKSTLIADIRRNLPKRWKVAFCAFTGKAAGVMKSKLIDANVLFDDHDFVGTIHSLCYQVREDPDTKLKVFERRYYIDYDLIVVDEASMVNKELFQDLRSYHIPMLFVGDHGQLPPISSDDFNLMANPMIRLEEVHRFGNQSALLDLSIMARNGIDIPFKRFDEHVVKVRETNPLVNEFITNNLNDFSNGVCLCGTNNTRVDVNQLIRMNLGVISDISDKIPRKEDRVVCLMNNKSLVDPIYNGQLGKIKEISCVDKLDDAYSMSIDMDDGSMYKGFVNKCNFGKMKYSDEGREFITLRELMSLKTYTTIREKKMMRGKMGNKKVRFDKFDFGYCLTVHKSQGSEWGNVLLFEETSGYWDEDYRRKWLYTAITRSNDNLMIIA